jgi:hypothetical protein
MRLQKAGKLTDAQRLGLIAARRTRRFKPGTFAHLGVICGRSVETIKAFFAAVGPALTRYTKAS